jgi:broad specificity phosphatase PhoE
MSSTTEIARPCRILLVRHGRTVMNAEVRFRGRLDIPLDDVGVREAHEAAESLATEGLSVVYTSPLGRARQVAEAIAERSSLGAVREQLDLINVDYGEWEALTKYECAERDPEAFRLYAEQPENSVCPGGEALADAADRIVRALQEIGSAHPGESVAAVTHGAMVRLAVLRVEGEPVGDWQFALPTGSATVFEVDAEGIKLISSPDRSRPDPRKAASRPPSAQTSVR